jgi:hypothetical protein
MGIDIIKIRLSKNARQQFLSTFLFLAVLPTACTRNTVSVDWFLTNPDKSALLEKQVPLGPSGEIESSLPDINVDTTEIYQSIDGFGFALTGCKERFIK